MNVVTSTVLTNLVGEITITIIVFTYLVFYKVLEKETPIATDPFRLYLVSQISLVLLG